VRYFISTFGGLGFVESLPHIFTTLHSGGCCSDREQSKKRKEAPQAAREDSNTYGGRPNSDGCGSHKKTKASEEAKGKVCGSIAGGRGRLDTNQTSAEVTSEEGNSGWRCTRRKLSDAIAADHGSTQHWPPIDRLYNFNFR
jgi:hypothetical protein